MATAAHTTPLGVTATVRLPQTFTPEQEHRHLLRLVSTALDRIGVLNRLLDPPADLPRSGLRLVGAAGDGLLFTAGGRDA